MTKVYIIAVANANGHNINLCPIYTTCLILTRPQLTKLQRLSFYRDCVCLNMGLAGDYRNLVFKSRESHGAIFYNSSLPRIQFHEFLTVSKIW